MCRSDSRSGHHSPILQCITQVDQTVQHYYRRISSYCTIRPPPHHTGSHKFSLQCINTKHRGHHHQSCLTALSGEVILNGASNIEWMSRILGMCQLVRLQRRFVRGASHDRHVNESKSPGGPFQTSITSLSGRAHLMYPCPVD